MGCDIHVAVESRKSYRSDKGGTVSYWHREFPDDEARDPWLVEQAEKYPGDYYAPRQWLVWYDDRNYDLFAMLAGVRNDGGIVPISEPRGLPDDVSEEVGELMNGGSSADIWLGDHSHSWLSLDELEEYFIARGGRRVSKRGVVSLPEFAEMTAEGRTKPREYCASVWGSKVVVLDADKAREQIAGGGLAVDVECHAYVDLAWEESVAERAGSFVTRVIPALQRVRERRGVSSEDVRIVFGFDS